MKNNIYLYLLVMTVVTYLIRVLPLTLIRKQIKNQFLKSFLYYVPYVTLAVMTFPAIIYATQSPISGILALIIGIVVAYTKENLFLVAVCCSLTVFISEFILFL